MYRPGFGDCFLLSFGSPARHMLIDFGAHMHGEIGTMEAIMDDIESETDKRLAVVVASHAHRDHISGFGKFVERFSTFTIGEVWLPWTDDPQDPDAKKLRTKQLALYDRLDKHLSASPPAADDLRGAAAVNALSNLRGNETATAALARAFGTGKARYLHAGADVHDAGKIAGLSAQVLGPSKDKTFLGRMDPPADQRYLAAPGEPANAVHPFLSLEIPSIAAEFSAEEAAAQPQVPANELVRLHELAESPAGALALALDNARNNTSLVLLLRYGGKSLLFPGDAQWGNWQSWIGTDDATQLIGELDFLKVAHHGSENATPVSVVQALRAQGLAVMVSTQNKPFPTIPRKPLLTALEKHSLDHVAVRSDWITVAGAAGSTPPASLPKGFASGPVWIDYSL